MHLDQSHLSTSETIPVAGVRRNARPGCVSLLLAGLMLASGIGNAQAVRATTYGTTSGTMPGSSRLAAGLQVSVKITQGLSSKTAAEGDQWDGVLARDLIVGGHLLTPSGTQVTGIVSKAISATRALGNGTLGVKLTSIRGTGISTEQVLRQGVNAALTSGGNMATAGIPGEAAQNTAAATPGAAGQNTPPQTDARIAPGSILSFVTE